MKTANRRAHGRLRLEGDRLQRHEFGLCPSAIGHGELKKQVSWVASVFVCVCGGVSVWVGVCSYRYMCVY